MGNNNHQIYSQLVDQPIKPSRFKRICVFCGSSTGNKPSYQLAAVQLGNQLVERNIDLVYGGGSIGLMGLIFKAVFNGGRHVLGVIPKSLMPREVIALQITGETVGEVRAVSGMHQRKAEMARQADAFIALPGGYGTLEELVEVITWALLGIHDKPVGLLNVDGYYNSLLSFIDKAVDEGFITPSAHHIIVSASTAHELMSKLEVFRLWIKELIRQARDNYRRPVIPVTFQDPTTSAYENNKLWIKELIRQARDNYRRSYYFRLREQQDYVPKHNGVAPKLSWEIEQQLCYAAKSEIVR